MNRNKKILHKAAVNVLGLTLASAVAAGTVGEFAAPVSVWAAETQKQEVRKTVYLNGSTKASEKADGSTEEKAVSSFGKALKCAGEDGLILVSGTVVIDEKTELKIPSNVTIKRAEGFEGKFVKITGKGTLTILGKGIQASDVDTDSAEAGKEAFQMKTAEEQKKPEDQQENTQEETPKPEKPDASEEEQKPDAPEKEPNEEEKLDGVEDGVDQAPEEKNPEDSQQGDSETEQKPQQPDVPEQQPDIEKPSEPETKPEKGPEAPQQPDIQQPGETEKQEAVLTVPENLVFQTKAEWEEFSFEEEEGFKGEGTFAWEGNTELTAYETQMTLRFTPENLKKWDYTKVSGWEEDSQTVVRKVRIFVEELKKTETEKPAQPQEEQGAESKDEVTIIPVEPTTPEEEKQEPQKPPVENSAQPGKLGEVAQEAPEVIPVGSLIDESGVQVYADFLPFYVDLQVSYNDSVSQLPDAGIGEILSAYELKLWDLKEDTEYQIPEGKKVKVLIPLPENADCYSDLAIAHYLGNNEYEYFIFDKDGKVGNMTIEVKDGEEYLAFETASFSPFNVGGHQIVGPGINSPGHKPSTGTGTGAGSQSTQQSGQQQSQQNNPSSGQNNASQSSQETSTTQKKPGNQTVSSAGSSNVTIIHTVKTGDDTEIAQYVLLGAGALALGAGAVVVGKKKKKQDK